MNYFSPTPGDQDCEIDAHVTKAGRTLAFADVEIRNKKTGKVTARGTHIKFIPPMPKPSASGVNDKMPPGTPSAAATPEAAELFISDMISDVREGFDLESTQNFEATALHGVKDITATHGQVVCTLPVTQRVQNRYNTLHGGCIGNGHMQYCTSGAYAHSMPACMSLNCNCFYCTVLIGGLGSCSKGDLRLMLLCSHIGRCHWVCCHHDHQ